MNREDIDFIVSGIKEACPFSSIEDIVLSMGIELKEVSSQSLLLQGCNACYVKSDNKEMILYSSSCPDEMRPFALAHELGHAILHDVELVHLSQLYKSTRIEREADYFATKLLDPDFELANFDGKSVEEIARALGVSERAVEYII